MKKKTDTNEKRKTRKEMSGGGVSCGGASAQGREGGVRWRIWKHEHKILRESQKIKKMKNRQSIKSFKFFFFFCFLLFRECHIVFSKKNFCFVVIFVMLDYLLSTFFLCRLLCLDKSLCTQKKFSVCPKTVFLYLKKNFVSHKKPFCIPKKKVAPQQIAVS